MINELTHIPVLLDEILDYLNKLQIILEKIIETLIFSP